ncbi:MAG: beta-lactamase family protein [Candidatus Omnitrophica bacterium]|nr:beta-lactamase family protein [Candidatus Omnitrophota bacterium]
MKKLIFVVPLVSIKIVFSQIPLSIEKIEKAYDYHKNKNGKCMIIMYDGNIIFEKYSKNSFPEKLQFLASGSKSFVGIVAICAVEDGLINLDDKVCETVEKWKKDSLKSQITYRHLLNLTCGLKPEGIIRNFNHLTWKDLLSIPAKEIPGKKFEYSGVPHNIFAYCLQLKLKNKTFEDYFKERVLDPLGIKLEYKMRFKDGNPQVAGGACITGRDWAKFGEFVQLGGTINGKKIVDSKLLSECFKGSEVFPAYGLTWWLIGKISQKNTSIFTNLIIEDIGWDKITNSDFIPKDLIAACGAGGQRLYIVPSYKLVIVRLGDLTFERKNRFNDFDFLSLLFKNF